MLNKLNNFLRIWMFIVLPFLLFFGGIYIYILLFGGTILGELLQGYLN